ncbi:MAG TPA: MBL fold metallo-hydrolase [Vicinamibacteria bacterium]|nr:MBL fold metallo-hydrolase [Vicinamibacteria bacterium]
MIRFETHGDVVFIRMARTLFGRPLFWTGAYLVDGLLIDCGPPATARELVGALADRQVEGLVLTHHHEDHVGAAPLLAAARGLRPQAHPAAVPLLEQGFAQEPYRRAVWGAPSRFRADALGEETASRSLRFRVIGTPGHSVDHVCLLEPRRGRLFTGDLFLAERLRYLRSDEDVCSLIESLDRAAGLGACEVFCAHRGPVRGGSAALARKADHLRSLRARVLDLLARGLPEPEVARRALGPEGPMTWLSRGRFSVVNFVRSIARDRRPE